MELQRYCEIYSYFCVFLQSCDASDDRDLRTGFWDGYCRSNSNKTQLCRALSQAEVNYLIASSSRIQQALLFCLFRNVLLSQGRAAALSERTGMSAFTYTSFWGQKYWQILKA